jgi:PleD family two-component response regulator
MAQGLGERLRGGVEALQVPSSDSRGPVRCTVSIGVSGPFSSLAERDRATREADHALYAAKAGGRNRVVAAPPEPEAASDRSDRSV